MSTLMPAAIGTRVHRARARLAEEALDALLIIKPENRTYLTGFTGSAGAVVVTPTEAHLLVDFRYVEQAAAEAPGFAQARVSNLLEGIGDMVTRRALRRVGYEADAVTVAQARRLEERAPDCVFVPLEGLDRMRWRKDAAEIARIREAAVIADRAFQTVLDEVRPGARERDLAVELEYRMRRLGADGIAFNTIVASGPRSALPHGRASDRSLEPGDFVTFDYGAVVGGYNSDCTRTVVLGTATAEQRRIYALVREALAAAEATLRPGMRGRDADAVARDLIAGAGHGEHFGHGLGHGVGLAVHEGPTLSPREEALLEADVVVTIEPGVYLPGWGGVRIEDLVVLRADGAEILGTAPKALLEVA